MFKFFVLSVAFAWINFLLCKGNSSHKNAKKHIILESNGECGNSLL